MTVTEQINPTVLVNMEDWGTQKYDELPDFAKKLIMESQEYKESIGTPEFSE